jgi:hypothetical protein
LKQELKNGLYKITQTFKVVDDYSINDEKFEMSFEVMEYLRGSIQIIS